MVRTTPTLDLKKLQSVQGEALQDSNKDVKPRAGASQEKKKFDEKNAVRQKAHVRLHRDKIMAFRRAAETRRTKFSDLINQALDIGMRELGITYD